MDFARGCFEFVVLSARFRVSAVKQDSHSHSCRRWYGLLITILNPISITSQEKSKHLGICIFHFKLLTQRITWGISITYAVADHQFQDKNSCNNWNVTYIHRVSGASLTLGAFVMVCMMHHQEGGPILIFRVCFDKTTWPTVSCPPLKSRLISTPQFQF